MSSNGEEKVYRILDANLNRLREALRVVEEHFRFFDSDSGLSQQLKSMRHSLRGIEEGLDRTKLLRSRDTAGDPFASGMNAGERDRRGAGDILTANLRRAQEASRVIEEYVKLTGGGEHAERAKTIRFDLYALEKRLAGNHQHGT